MARAEQRQAKDDSFPTPEAKIKELRKQRDPTLGQIAVNRYDFIDALIEAFDENPADLKRTKDELRRVSDERAQMYLNNQELEASIKAVHDRNVELAAENESLRGQITVVVNQTLPPKEETGGDPPF